LAWKASEEERAIVCALRRATGFPLDDLTFGVAHFLPHLNRDAVSRILKAESLTRLPPSARSPKPHGVFKTSELGFVPLDVKHRPKLRDRDGLTRQRSLEGAIDRCSRGVHLAVKDDETTASAVAFLKEAVRAFPFQVTHVLTDRGSCFVADAFEAACRKLRVDHRTTRPYTPRTNGRVERFNGRVQREVLGITIHSHRDLEILLRGFNRAYNARRQRVLGGLSPDEAVRRRLEAHPRLASKCHEPPSDPCVLPKALMIIEAAKDVSHPNSLTGGTDPNPSWAVHPNERWCGTAPYRPGLSIRVRCDPKGAFMPQIQVAGLDPSCLRSTQSRRTDLSSSARCGARRPPRAYSRCGAGCIPWRPSQPAGPRRSQTARCSEPNTDRTNATSRRVSSVSW